MSTAPDTRPVLVAYDASAEAQAALREAVALFGRRPLIVVSVGEPELAQTGDAAQAGADEARRLGATVEALAVADSADVAETLASIAEDRDAVAVVVGSRGLGAIKARLLGSTSRKLLHDTQRPVLVVRAA
jgi:nucleotide-binding universal stress UspA family protein